MTETQAELAVMTRTAAKFDQVNDALQGTLRGLMSELSVLQGAWRGLGAEAFERARSQYAADLRRLGGALAETAEAIRSAGGGYQAADAGAAARMARSGGSIELPL
ncbi:WXG100 family type VII secretion target [Actinoplanes sp. CA-015351]|uniref:ESAT-6-like protein n=1 Tax=Actinoplanes lutulentus TaxID=1287878 RepID=A0A327Z5I6_9ACTN|nr:WXG100 family type VII secretion target [Actinoplanes lutulentus]MBB2945061.1 WXG100 family type VII secretion target [Actinoplanes lutulentus]RAK31856.1 WXG100 family type VII secretion target [Actinoplanes lutulentus]